MSETINPYGAPKLYFDPSLEGSDSSYLSELGLKFDGKNWLDSGGNAIKDVNSVLADKPFSVGGLAGADLLKGAMGVGQLGLGVMSFLDQKKTAKKQRGLMDQQMQQNSFLLNQAKDRQSEISNQFGGGGLAASVK